MSEEFARIGPVCNAADKQLFEWRADPMVGINPHFGSLRLVGRDRLLEMGEVVRGRPTGTVSFLFTDVEGSTPLWERHAGAMGVALARHDVLVRGAIERRGGSVFSTAGDAFCAAFWTPADAIGAVLDAQRLLQAAPSLDNALLHGYGEFVAGHVASGAGDKAGAILHFEELARLGDAAGSPHLRAMAPWSIAHVAHALTDRQAAIEAYRSAVKSLHDARDWLHLWPVIELLAGWWALNGAFEQSAVAVGHLDAHGIATGATARRRARTVAMLAGLPTTDAALDHGRRLKRDQLVAYILHELDTGQ